MEMNNIIKHQFTITYESSIDTNTGEILETKIVSKSEPKQVSSKKSKIEDTTPKLYLEENKYKLNSAAVELLGANPDDKIDIKYEQAKNGTFPVIGLDDNFGTHSGNRLTKSNTVAFRGSKNEELSKFGKEFTIVAHPNKDSLFILSTGEIPEIEKLDGDENIQIDNEDLDFSDFEDNVTEIDSNFFNFNL